MLDEEERNSLSGDQAFDDSPPVGASNDPNGEDAGQLAAEAAVLAPEVDVAGSDPEPMAMPVDGPPADPTAAKLDQPNGHASEELRKDEV
jgi:hypothetical protein